MVNDIMSRKVRSVWRLLLGSFITLLGFAACKTVKKAQRGEEPEVLYGAPPVTIDRQKPIDVLKPLYGVPPIRMERVPE